MLVKILIVVSIVIIGVLIYAGLQSPNYTISRSLLIKATPTTLFPYINNSQKSNEWMPWKEVDPNLQMTYSGPDQGIGSKAAWSSDGKMGVGQSEVIESLADKSVKTQLNYQKPFEMSQLAEVSLEPSTDGTVVKWTVSGQNNFVGRVFCIFMNMDKMVGPMFEKGLTQLKALAETQQ